MMKYKIRSFLLAFVVMLNMFCGVKAEEIDLNETGSISVTLSDLENNQPIQEAKLAVYYIASINQDSSNHIFYSYCDDFKDCGVLLDDPELNLKLDKIVYKDIYTYLVETDNNGTATLSNLPLGLYFVKQMNEIDGYAPCKPFLVTLPMLENNHYIYNVNASPKTEIEKLVSITIKKEWKADENAKIPNEVTIQLYKEDEVVKTAVLNEQNDWQITYPNMPKSDAYFVKEVNIPNGFTPIYDQYDYIFTVTNVSSLINTGQLIWPIPVLGFSGIIFITIGYIMIRKTGKQND